MHINKTTFFAYARRSPFGGRLSQGQVDGCNAILDAFSNDRIEHVAYAMATAFHETGGKMLPVEENLNYTAAGLLKTFPKYFDAHTAKQYAKKSQAIANRAYANRMGNGDESSGDGWKYRGRGTVQITGWENYERAGYELGVDLITNPEKALEPKISSEILHSGMTRGWFTGKKLSDYFNDRMSDPLNARRIVNGADKAKLIAGYHKSFLDALKAAESTTPQPADVVKDDAKPDDVAPTESKSVLAIATSGAGALATSVIAAVNNPWALGAVFGIIIAGGVLFWLFKTGRLEQKKESAV